MCNFFFPSGIINDNFCCLRGQVPCKDVDAVKKITVEFSEEFQLTQHPSESVLNENETTLHNHKDDASLCQVATTAAEQLVMPHSSDQVNEDSYR